MAIQYDLVLLHAPSVYDFRNSSMLSGPISDVVPSSPIFEMYPIGITSIAQYLEEFGFRVKIINIANRMLMDENFDVEKKIRGIKTRAFGIDLHWMPHCHGSIELARIVKKIHPTIPVIFGGLSSTYYHKELIEYDCIDFVMRGDTTEKLMLLWIDRLTKGIKNFSNIPNLTWKIDGEIHYNNLSYVPKDFDDYDIPGYRYCIKNVFKYGNFLDPLPYKGWLQYPNTALLSAKGCTNNCIICGGSKNAANTNCNRPKIATRSPQKLVEDILFIQRWSRAPIFILDDLRQIGNAYIDEFFSLLKKVKVKNELVFEIFQYAPESFYQRMNESLPNKGYSIEITLETHDFSIRRHNGKMNCTNPKVIETLQFALKHGCKKIDLFFMTGIPDQTYDSAMQNIDFVEEIHVACGNDPRLCYFVAPLAPFLDPACKAFEEPEKYGYIRHCHTFEDHREAITSPSWKYMLSYETTSMSRDDIVSSTYDSAEKLNDFKFKHGLIDRATHDGVSSRLEESRKYIALIDNYMKLPKSEQKAEMEKIKLNIKNINRHSIAGQHELKWAKAKNFAHFFSLTVVGIELLFHDWFGRKGKKAIREVELEILKI